MALERVGVGMRQGEATFYAKVNAALIVMENDGTLDNISDTCVQG
ncbi:hypothetical protein [Marinomonas sp. TW1]|nr:hypothetical protein [Marinomonas sp. TW1]